MCVWVGGRSMKYGKMSHNSRVGKGKYQVKMGNNMGKKMATTLKKYKIFTYKIAFLLVNMYVSFETRCQFCWAKNCVKVLMLSNFFRKIVSIIIKFLKSIEPSIVHKRVFYSTVFLSPHLLENS